MSTAMSDLLVCHRCHASLPPQAKFCPTCGNEIHSTEESQPAKRAAKKICPSCGTANSAESKFCFGCGLPLDGEEYQASRPAGEKSKKQSKTKKGSDSRSNIYLIVFSLFALAVAASVILEMRNSSVGNVEAKQESNPPPASPLTNETVIKDISNLENILKSDPENNDALLQLANRLHDAKFFIRAIDMYKKYLAKNPKAADARVDLGICYFETGDSKSAVQEVEKALAIDPKHQMAMFNLGIIQLNQRNMDEAKKWFKKCVDIDPESVAGKKAEELLKQH